MNISPTRTKSDTNVKVTELITPMGCVIEQRVFENVLGALKVFLVLEYVRYIDLIVLHFI